MDDTKAYMGNELDLFSAAIRWRKYLCSKISAVIGAEVLEVGAGIGTNTIALCETRHKRWLCVEPDGNLASKLSSKIRRNFNLAAVELRQGTLESIRDSGYFDTVLYIDVLEHIKDDRREIELAIKSLNREGRLVVVAPAHQCLYSPFDHAVGHFRRYDKKLLRSIVPSGLELEQLYYLDSAGMAASIGNLLFLRKSIPEMKEILFWDKWLIPASIWLDPLFCYKIGKTIVGVWRKTAN